MPENNSKIISIVSMVFLISLGLFILGLKVGKSQIWPYKLIEDTHKSVLSILKFGEIIQTNRIIKAPDYVSREKFTIYKKAQIQPGYYALMGFDSQNDKYTAWLINETGKRLHTWEISYNTLDPVESERFISPHAFSVMKDGSLLVSFDSGNLMARIDQCSKPIWSKKGVFHHSISQAEDGSYWTWRGSNTAYGHFSYLTNFDGETGNTIKEIGLIEDVIRSNYETALKFGLRHDYPFKEFDTKPDNEKESDLFHPNDLDVLHSDIAGMFPNFKAGDLLISFRNTHLVAVIDSTTKEVKWSGNGPWRYQHDPDFTKDGYISIYNNNTDFKRSEIIKVHPTTGEVINEQKDGDLYFYSQTQGKHQYLPNGNLYIINPDEGRAVQVTSEGDKVFEYNNISSFTNEYNEHLANGMWLPTDYFENSIPKCPTIN